MEEANKTEDPYTTRELNMKFKYLADKIDENHQETTDAINLLDRRNTDKQKEMMNMLGKIETQTIKTNGRVRSLEAWKLGIAMCLTLFTIVILPLLVYIFTNLNKSVVQNQKSIQSLQMSK